MDFIELARSRYSCKKFDSRQISKEQLDSILEAGLQQPRTCRSSMSMWYSQQKGLPKSMP